MKDLHTLEKEIEELEDTLMEKQAQADALAKAEFFNDISDQLNEWHQHKWIHDKHNELENLLYRAMEMADKVYTELEEELEDE